jgi:esterase/lipase
MPSPFLARTATSLTALVKASITALLAILITLFFLLFSNNTTPLTLSNSALENCLSMNKHYNTTSQLIDQGLFRYTNIPDKVIPPFSYNKEVSFEEYIRYSHQVILGKNPKAHLPCDIATDTYKILAKQAQQATSAATDFNRIPSAQWSSVPRVYQLITPFELKQPIKQAVGKTKGILLIHGLTDSPYSFHDLAYFYYRQGFNVRTLLLPGHSTAPSDLITAQLSEWQQATQYGIERMSEDFDQVYLGGLSTGGALILDYLMQHYLPQKKADFKIKGLFMWSLASKAKNKFSGLAQYVDLVPGVDWIGVDADTDFAKYESFPYNAAAQVHELMERISPQQLANKIVDKKGLNDIPLFVIASEPDQTIDTAATLSLINAWHKKSSISEKSHQNNTTFIYYGDEGSGRAGLSDSIKLITPTCKDKSRCEKALENVLDIAHGATTHAPSNPHYGINGLYRNCGHYLSGSTNYQLCKEAEYVLLGEITSKNKQLSRPLQRLTFNPYYDEMLKEILIFLEESKR